MGKFIEVKKAIVDEYLAENPEQDPDNLPDWFVTAMDLKPEAHVDTQCIIQRRIDSFISKTVNAPRGYTVDQVGSIYQRLYNGGAKGGTGYVDGSRDSQVLTLTAEDNNQEESLEISRPPVFIKENIQVLKQPNITIGTEIGDRCPVCGEGDIVEIGGCNTCASCGAQLKCGL